MKTDLLETQDMRFSQTNNSVKVFTEPFNTKTLPVAYSVQSSDLLK